MHPTLRRLPPVLALTVPLVLAGTSATGLPTMGVPIDSEGAFDPHAEMSETEHADSTEPAEEHEDMPAEEHAESETEKHEESGPQARPRTAVLSTFAGVNSAVLGAAALLRRRDRSRPQHRPRGVSASPAPEA